MLLRSVICCLAILLSSTATANHVRLASSSSVVSSGLLDILLPAFTRDTGYEVQVHAVGSGIALRMGREGNADVVMSHAPDAEKQFVAAGHGLSRRRFMHNDFMIVGPPDDPAGVAGLTDGVQAFRRIAQHQSVFLSRADDSGTHKKEMAMWQASGADPYGRPWYQEIGVGSGEILRMADEQQAYTLIDRGTWLAHRERLQLKLLTEGDSLLHNPYSVIIVNPARHPSINAEGARAFADWLASPPAQRLIRDFRRHGQALYVPDLPTQ